VRSALGCQLLATLSLFRTERGLRATLHLPLTLLRPARAAGAFLNYVGTIQVRQPARRACRSARRVTRSMVSPLTRLFYAAQGRHDDQRDLL
jgi:hypothetical protein